MILCLSSSFALECYIAIRLKKLPWCSLRTVTIGHLLMGSGLLLSSIKVSSMAMYGIKIPLAFLIFQFLYFLKYRDHALELAKKYLTRTNRINPDQEMGNINDFGIFVGPQNANNRGKTMDKPNEIRVFSISVGESNSDEFGGVFIG